MPGACEMPWVPAVWLCGVLPYGGVWNYKSALGAMGLTIMQPKTVCSVPVLKYHIKSLWHYTPGRHTLKPQLQHVAKAHSSPTPFYVTETRLCITCWRG